MVALFFFLCVHVYVSKHILCALLFNGVGIGNWISIKLRMSSLLGSTSFRDGSPPTMSTYPDLYSEIPKHHGNMWKSPPVMTLFCCFFLFAWQFSELGTKIEALTPIQSIHLPREFSTTPGDGEPAAGVVRRRIYAPYQGIAVIVISDWVPWIFWWTEIAWKEVTLLL